MQQHVASYRGELLGATQRRATIDAIRAPGRTMGKTENVDAFLFEPSFAIEARGPRQVLAGVFVVNAPVAFAVRFDVAMRSRDARAFDASSRAALRLDWLPRGRYRLELALPGAVEAGEVDVTLRVLHRHGMAEVEGGRLERRFAAASQSTGTD